MGPVFAAGSVLISIFVSCACLQQRRHIQAIAGRSTTSRKSQAGKSQAGKSQAWKTQAGKSQARRIDNLQFHHRAITHEDIISRNYSEDHMTEPRSFIDDEMEVPYTRKPIEVAPSPH